MSSLTGNFFRVYSIVKAEKPQGLLRLFYGFYNSSASWILKDCPADCSISEATGTEAVGGFFVFGFEENGIDTAFLIKEEDIRKHHSRADAAAKMDGGDAGPVVEPDADEVEIFPCDKYGRMCAPSCRMIRCRLGRSKWMGNAAATSWQNFSF